jgi:hypothetical protein
MKMILSYACLVIQSVVSRQRLKMRVSKSVAVLQLKPQNRSTA